MGIKALSASQLAALSARAATPAGKSKASITLSSNLLKIIDILAGEARNAEGDDSAAYQAGWTGA